MSTPATSRLTTLVERTAQPPAAAAPLPSRFLRGATAAIVGMVVLAAAADDELFAFQ